jgi:hypothetical protein
MKLLIQIELFEIINLFIFIRINVFFAFDWMKRCRDTWKVEVFIVDLNIFYCQIYRIEHKCLLLNKYDWSWHLISQGITFAGGLLVLLGISCPIINVSALNYSLLDICIIENYNY